MEVLTVGSGGVNAGTVYYGTGSISSGVPANKYMAIGVGMGRSLNAFYHVPSNEKAMLENLSVVSAVTNGSTTLMEVVARVSGYSWQTFKKFKVPGNNGATTIENNTPLYFGPSTDIELRATSSGTSTDVGVDASLITIK